MRYVIGIVPLVVILAASGCGGSGPNAVSTPVAADTTTSPASRPQAPADPGALQAESTAASTGDIPDNQVFLTFRNRAGGYSIKYPEGWARQGTGRRVVIRDKNNIVRIDVSRGARPTVASVARLPGARVTKPVHILMVSGSSVVGVTYITRSAPNPVTGKSVELVVDRYYLWRDGHRAVVDLGTPVGVDNVDAYRLMIESFRWR